VVSKMSVSGGCPARPDTFLTDDVTSSYPIYILLVVSGFVWGGDVINFGRFYWTNFSEVG